jgi:hypothetical protein
LWLLYQVCGSKPIDNQVTCASMWIQKYIQLNPRPRGFHPGTAEILRELPD